jgi:hypothetical protein
MVTRDVERINGLVKRLDDLCREASEIRDALARAALQRQVWPAKHSVGAVVTKSVLPSDFFPTSTVSAES